MRASYFDVDEEKIFDRLSPRDIPYPSGPDAATLLYGRAYTAALGLSEFECHDIGEVMRYLEQGLTVRRADQSLDPHSIFQVHTYI